MGRLTNAIGRIVTDVIFGLIGAILGLVAVVAIAMPFENSCKTAPGLGWFLGAPGGFVLGVIISEKFAVPRPKKKG